MRNPRWLIAFADLCLLLVGFFVLLHAHGNAGAAAASMRAAFGVAGASTTHTYRADILFERGEAVLRPEAARSFAADGARANAAGRRVRIDSDGAEPATARFDGWELAAARAAAVARAIGRGGLAGDRIDIGLGSANARAGGQMLQIATIG